MEIFRLEPPSSKYLALFDAAEVCMDPAGGKACLELNVPQAFDAQFSLEVCFDAADGTPDPTAFALARLAMAHIVELDALARAWSIAQGPPDHGEYLAYLVARPGEVGLNYFATYVNTEWCVWFRRDDGGAFRQVRVGA
jgi:hypothetical protein